MITARSRKFSYNGLSTHLAGRLMLRGSQFSVAYVFFGTLVTAILLTFGQLWPVVFLTTQLLFIYVGSEYLIRNIPVRIQQIQNSNCLRADGSHSQHRQSIENREHQKLLSEFRMLLLVAVAPTIFWLFYQPSELNKAIIASVAWFCFASLMVRSGYLYFMNRFVFDLKRRAQQYRLRDLDMIIREEEMFAQRNRSRHKLAELKKKRPRINSTQSTIANESS